MRHLVRTTEDGRRLLIVQKDQLVARSLARYLRAAFEEVEIALSPGAAELVLSDPLRTPTHVVCGLDFGAGSPSGNEVIPRWRETYPKLTCVVLATGRSDLPVALEGVDAIYLKPSSPALLASMLAET